MTKNKKTTEKKPKTSTKVVQEAKYSKDEIIDAASYFGEKQEVIAGALRLENKEEFTRNEINNAIRKFKTRKV